MNVDKTLRIAAEQLNASLDTEPIPDSARTARSGWMVVALAAVVTLGLVGGVTLLFGGRGSDSDIAATTSSPTSTTAAAPEGDPVTFVDEEYGFEIVYPADWYRADEVLAPALTSPPQTIQEILSLGTYPLRPGATRCDHIPENALLDLAPNDALVSIVLSNATSGTPWPEAFAPDSFLPTDTQIDAQTCIDRPDLDARWGVFNFEGHGVQVLVVFGDNVDADTQAETWRTLDSLAWTATTTSTTTTTTTTTAAPLADPATGPLFGEPSNVVLLFDNGLNGVLAIDPDNRIGSRIDIGGQAAGDQPYRLTRVGDSLIVGWGSIYASNIQTGESTLVGSATIYVPATEPDRVWLIKWAGGRIGQGTATAWQADTTGQQLTEPVEIEVDGYPASGVPGGLALETDDGIHLWYPDGSMTNIGPGIVVDVSGDQLAYCPTSQCTQMHIFNLRTEETVIVSSDDGFKTWNFGGRTAEFSPDGTYLALTTNTGLVLATTETGVAIDIAIEISSNQPLYVGWSPDGSALFAASYSYGYSDTNLARYDIETRSLATAHLPFGGALSFIVLEPDEANHYLIDQEEL